MVSKSVHGDKGSLTGELPNKFGERTIPHENFEGGVTKELETEHSRKKRQLQDTVQMKNHLWRN